jgi:hypothetical protein
MAFPDTVLASASRSVLRWVRRWFRYRRFRLALVPEHEIEVHDGVYRALGNDPQFRLTAVRLVPVALRSARADGAPAT